MIDVRLLAAHEAAAYRALMLEAYVLHPDAFTSSYDERARLPLTWWVQRIGNGIDDKEVVFGAFIDGELAGAAGLTFETREKAMHKATLFGMFVHDRFRGLGLARRLVHAVLGHAASRTGVKLIQLTVTEGNVAAQRLYESFGFQTFGVEPMAVRVGPTYLSKVHMWREIQTSADGG